MPDEPADHDSVEAVPADAALPGEDVDGPEATVIREVGGNACASR